MSSSPLLKMIVLVLLSLGLSLEESKTDVGMWGELEKILRFKKCLLSINWVKFYFFDFFFIYNFFHTVPTGIMITLKLSVSD